MTIEELVDAALVPVQDFLTTAANGDVYKNENYEASVLLRLDYEVASDANLSPNEAVRLMVEQMKGDLVDVIENGDKNLSSDPLLKAMDGAVKRKMCPVDVKVTTASYYSSYKKGKNAYEYTIFFNLYVAWDAVSHREEQKIKESLSV